MHSIATMINTAVSKMRSVELTIKELLNMPLLQEAQVMSGAKGLERFVKQIDMLEQPYTIKDYPKGTLIFIDAYPIQQQPEVLIHMIEQLHTSEAVGLMIRSAQKIHPILTEAILQSDLYELPIISLPEHISYMDITYAAIEQTLYRQEKLRQRSDETYRTLTAMVLENIGIQAVSDHVAGLLKAPVAIIDHSETLIVSSPIGWDFRQARYPVRRNINIDQRSVAYLLIDKEQWNAMEEVGIEQARLVLALELMRNKIIEDTENRLRGNFIDELMTPPAPPRHEVEQRGQQLGMNPLHLWEVAVIEGSVAPDEEWMTRLLYQEAAKYNIRPHIEFRSNRAILFLPTPQVKATPAIDAGQSSIPWATIVLSWLNDQEGKLAGYRSGIGRPKALWDIHEGFSEARNALTISRRLSGETALTAYKDIEVYHLLRGTMDEKGFGLLFDRKLGKLKQYDEEHTTDLLRTLFFYLESRSSLIETARQLSIHRNSVKYRLERIRDITGFDLNDPHEQFVYQMCLIYYYLLEHSE